MQCAPIPVAKDDSACIEWTDYVVCGRAWAEHNNLKKHLAHLAVRDGHILAQSPPDELLSQPNGRAEAGTVCYEPARRPSGASDKSSFRPLLSRTSGHVSRHGALRPRRAALGRTSPRALEPSRIIVLNKQQSPLSK